MLVCVFFSFLHTGPRVQRASGIPRALCNRRTRKVHAQLGRIAPRDREAVFEIVHVIARSESDEAIHSYFAATWIASRALAKTVSRRAPHLQLSSPGLPPSLTLQRAPQNACPPQHLGSTAARHP